mmetsp:Transcript_1645/g.1114  ORF Transcript_1645/g.1114 Transcript_1645/m.1114 type:complete len:85 (+) Transcript_1645:38-292(+)
MVSRLRVKLLTKDYPTSSSQCGYHFSSSKFHLTPHPQLAYKSYCLIWNFSTPSLRKMNSERNIPLSQKDILRNGMEIQICFLDF